MTNYGGFCNNGINCHDRESEIAKFCLKITCVARVLFKIWSSATDYLKNDDIVRHTVFAAIDTGKVCRNTVCMPGFSLYSQPLS